MAADALARRDRRAARLRGRARATPDLTAGRPPGIVAAGWGVRYPGRAGWAVRGLDLRIEPGERVLVRGRSGSGKSTLLAAIAGLLDAQSIETEGVLHVDGASPAEAADRIGILFQDPESQLVMGRAGDDVAFGLENRCVPTPEIAGRVDAALASVEFPYGSDRPTEALSGGERQRLALAGVLALRPDLLLLDEPTASLDPDSAGTIREVVRRIVERRDVTLLVVDHRTDDWLPLVDRVVVVDGPAGVIADGPPEPTTAESPPAPRAAVAAADSLVVGESVTFRYPGSMQDALDAVDAELRAGDVLAVTGSNGSGKSTLALLLGGLLDPRGGSVRATEALAPGRGGERLAAWSASTLVRHVGSVFQDPEHQFLTGSVRAELMLGPRRARVGEAEAAARADELMAGSRLSHLADANPFTLSGGEKRRLSVATALATRPRVLVLDEPTFGQDDADVMDLLDRLAALRDGGTGICVVTHDDRFVTAIADRTLALTRPS